MFKLHLISELKEAFINLRGEEVEPPRPVKLPFPIPSAHKKMVISDKKCIGCGACATVCPACCISFLDNKKYRTLKIDIADCIYCGVCSEVCPENAIVLMSGNELFSTNKEHLYHELRIKLKRCEHCREVISTKKGVLKTVKDFFSQSAINPRELEWVNLCPSCRRKFHSNTLITQRIK